MGNSKTKGRIDYLDGTRALFSLIVVTHHFVYAFYPQVKKFLFTDGNLAVMFFFVLSGFVAGLSIYKKSYSGMNTFFEILKFPVRRYFRLLPVVAGTIIISFVIYVCGGYFSQNAGEFYSLGWLSGYFALGNITVKEVIFTAFLGAFFSRPELNSPLWTIKYEFVALSIAYALVLMVYKWEYRRILYIIIIVLFSSQFEIAGFETIYIACIIFGILISDLYNDHDSETCIWYKLKTIGGGVLLFGNL